MRPALLLAAMILFCHSAAQRRNLLVAGPSTESSSSQTPAASDTYTPWDTSVDLNWVYTTPTHWKHAPRGIDESWSFANLAILYPEGQYLEISASLLKRDKSQSVAVSNGDGLLLRTGTWSRTEEQVIRVHSHEVFWSTETVAKYKCDPSRKCEFQEPHAEPFTTDTCGLEGHSATHLAAAIHCNRVLLAPAKLNLDLTQLHSLAEEAFHAAPIQ
jgi:hypothetical protein